MHHATRRWLVEPVPNVETLAERLCEHTWPLCQGFELSGYLFLNDAKRGEENQEYVIVKRDGARFFQVESIDFSWCSLERAFQVIDDALLGEYDASDERQELPLAGRLDPRGKHKPCDLCTRKRRRTKRQGGAK